MYRKAILLLTVVSLFHTTICDAKTEQESNLLAVYGEMTRGFDDESLTTVRLMRTGRFALAESIMKKAPQLLHDDQLFARFVICTYVQGHYQDTITACNDWLQANESAPDDAKSLVFEFIGFSDYWNDKVDEAIAAFNRAQELDPSSTAKIGMENAIARKENRYDFVRGSRPEFAKMLMRHSGIPAIEFIDEQHPVNADNAKSVQVVDIVKQATELEACGEFDKAAVVYQKAAELAPADSSLLGALALCTMTASEQNADKKAVEAGLLCAATYFERALELNSNDWRISNDLAIDLYKRADFEKSVPIFTRLLKDKNVPQAQLTAIESAINHVQTAQKIENYFEKKWSNLLQPIEPSD